MGNAFFLVSDENPKVTERAANLHKTSKETRDQACQLLKSRRYSIKTRFSNLEKIFELRRLSHKIKQINAPLRFKNQVSSTKAQKQSSRGVL